MSEKTRKKKDGEDKNKNNQRMREANAKEPKNNERRRTAATRNVRKAWARRDRLWIWGKKLK